MSTGKKGVEASFKSMDTEEFLDIHFNRPIGYVWALFFQRFGVHPNVVTILSIILGVAAGVMFYYPDMTHTLIGIFLLMWANHYDSCDGQPGTYDRQEKPAGDVCSTDLPAIFGLLPSMSLSVCA